MVEELAINESYKLTQMIVFILAEIHPIFIWSVVNACLLTISRRVVWLIVNLSDLRLLLLEVVFNQTRELMISVEIDKLLNRIFAKALWSELQTQTMEKHNTQSPNVHSLVALSNLHPSVECLRRQVNDIRVVHIHFAKVYMAHILQFYSAFIVK